MPVTGLLSNLHLRLLAVVSDACPNNPSPGTNKLFILMCNRKTLLRSGFLLFLTTLLPTAVTADELQELAEKSKELIRIFSGQLQSEYAKVAQENNPEISMRVCTITAPEKAVEISKDGWSIRRISLNPINKNNTPDQFEEKILKDFEKKKSAGWSIDQLSYIKMTEIANQSEFRYLKAIAGEELCLSCHGSTVPEIIAFKLDKLYPDHQAKDLKSGDIHGAYVVEKKETKNYISEPARSGEQYTLPEYRE